MVVKDNVPFAEISVDAPLARLSRLWFPFSMRVKSLNSPHICDVAPLSRHHFVSSTHIAF